MADHEQQSTRYYHRPGYTFKPFIQSFSQLFNHSTNQSSNHSANQSFKVKSFNQSWVNWLIDWWLADLVVLSVSQSSTSKSDVHSFNSNYIILKQSISTIVYLTWQSVNQSVNKSVNQPVNQFVSQSIGHLISLSVNQLVNQSISQLVR